MRPVRDWLRSQLRDGFESCRWNLGRRGEGVLAVGRIEVCTVHVLFGYLILMGVAIGAEECHPEAQLLYFRIEG